MGNVRICIAGFFVLLALFASAGIWFYFLPEDEGKSVTAAAVDEGPEAVETSGVVLPEADIPAPVDAKMKPPRTESVPAVAVQMVANSGSGAIPPKEAGADYSFLLATSLPPAMTLQEWRSEKNSLMDVWVFRSEPPDGLARVLIGIATDPDQDVVVRDYALQHLISIYDSAVPDRASMRDALYRALEERQTSLPGTALLALTRLARRYPEVDPAKVGESALALAGDENCGVMGRITALQVCAGLDMREAVPVAQGILRNPGNPMLRRSARAALEKLGQAHPELASAIGSLPAQEDCHDCP